MPGKHRMLISPEATKVLRRSMGKNPNAIKAMRNYRKIVRDTLKELSIPNQVHSKIEKIESGLRIIGRVKAEQMYGMTLKRSDFISVIRTAIDCMPIYRQTKRVSFQQKNRMETALIDVIKKMKKTREIDVTVRGKGNIFPDESMARLLGDIRQVFKISLEETLQQDFKRYNQLTDKGFKAETDNALYKENMKMYREQQLRKAKEQFKKLDPHKKH